MRKLVSTLSTTSLAVAATLSGAAYAQTAAPAAPMARAAKPDMTRAQAQARAEAMFVRMDANRDGTLDQADRAAAKAAMFDRLDADRDGALTQSELAARGGDRTGKARMARREGAPAATEAQKTERRAAMFARVDTDSNGTISRAEFDTMRAARGPGMKHGGAAKADHAGQRHGNAMMRGPDARGKAGMRAPTTRQAFVANALAMFDRADANRDGTVTQAERRAAHEAVRKQWQDKSATGQQG